MDFVDYTDDKELKNTENVGNKANVCLSNSNCHAMCNLILHLQNALLQYSCPIGVLEHPIGGNTRDNWKV